MPEPECGFARDHPQPAQAGERRDDVRRDCIAQAGEVLRQTGPAERQNRNRRPFATCVRRNSSFGLGCGPRSNDFCRSDPDRRDKAMPNTTNSSDEVLPVPVIPECLADGLQHSRDSGVRNETSGPDRRDHFVLTDDPLVVLGQKAQQPEGLRFKLDQALTQFRSSTRSVSSSNGVKLQFHVRP
jgi:hypothetical protein